MISHLRADIGIATVTAQGIIFNGRLYTNSAVIKKKWFVLAREEGEWKIPVVYLHNYYEAIIIISIKHQEVSLATCVNVRDLNLKEVEHYHKKINQLKELKKNTTEQIN
ncbi:hypothetical protein [Paenibacillus sp. UASWS1643]|uniref:hypothetical protein n=1 Tax=Paenibacillus sp. UASWS1643 TaxID=2580422 RepID=UPI00123AE0E8|nr:hypothetical protein [Paenibacillus sp. UASWS1643]KAA8745352.1 hypothetical protein FE296_26025 [Paenibacillus sp. UASWS1643]